MTWSVVHGTEANSGAHTEGAPEREILRGVQDVQQPVASARRRRRPARGTVVLIDCAVVCMAVPQAVVEFHAYAQVVWRSVRDAMRAGKIVVATFDEPEVVTNAKRLEQARRDATKRKRKVVHCSDDLVTLVAPPSPHFTRAHLLACQNVHALKDHRPCKARFFDEIAIFMLKEATDAVARWKANGHDAGALLLDGVDVRGAELPAGEAGSRGWLARTRSSSGSSRAIRPLGRAT